MKIIIESVNELDDWRIEDLYDEYKHLKDLGFLVNIE